ncbi:MAG: GH3 auxin-responsive promoter family protein [Bacteroidetes bacterium]|nr:GH3 auxin-responsive promoter family protein [Bacteroidota bacterium]
MAMDFLTQLFHRGRNITDVLSFNRARAVKWQEKTLRKMLYKARNTEYGRKHGFDHILISGDPVANFCKRVPINHYGTMHPYWQREFEGGADITWPGHPQYFALSSGTTEGSSKFIPVTGDQLKSIKRASLRQLFAVARTDVPKDFFTKHYLAIGGSTSLNYNGTSYYGDLSGITTSTMPGWFARFAQPGEEISSQTDWHRKIELMVEHAREWDIVMIAGGPAWIKILLERIIERYRLNHIHEIWPNFSVYVWGAVSLKPYRASIDSMLGQPIKYFETYLASEGFIAFQTRQGSEGMRLVFRNNTFYEFIPFNNDNFGEDGLPLPEARTVSLADVREDVDYAILITTPAGAWRYLIGDTVRFTDADACEIRITGRTRQFLSICGEHLSVENMNDGLARVAAEFGAVFPEYTVKGGNWNGTFGHSWYLACNKHGLDAEAVKTRLDQVLAELNDDYAVERKHVLKGMELKLLPESVFLGWMEKQGKLGGQAKFPRVLADHLYDDWCQYLSNHTQPQ